MWKSMKRRGNKLKTICAWCLKEQGIPPVEGDSHGICQRHRREAMEEMEKGGDDETKR